MPFRPAGRIPPWNRGAEAIFGYSAAEAIGSPISLLVAPERLPRLPSFMEHLLQGNCVRRYESICLRRDGGKIDVSVTGTPIRNRSGAVVAVSLILGDISHGKEIEKALRESEERFRI